MDTFITDKMGKWWSEPHNVMMRVNKYRYSGQTTYFEEGKKAHLVNIFSFWKFGLLWTKSVSGHLPE